MKKLTLLSSQGGCAAKVGPDELYQILNGIDTGSNIHPFFKKEDAGSIKISNELSIVQSIDVITPIVDDPFVYGEIAVEHALSDLFAMMAVPISGLFILGFPSFAINIEIANNILRGAIDRLNKHNCTLLKGHTINSKELFFGASVTGRLISYKYKKINYGDKIILTKPIGSGIISSALKINNLGEKIVGYSYEFAITSEKIMLESNHAASNIMRKFDIHACTDVTGFGLIGHLYELLINSKYSAEINFESIPLIPGALSIAKQDIFSSIGQKNFSFWSSYCSFEEKITFEEKNLLFDPQTSGGLLIVIAKEQAEHFLSSLKKEGILGCSIIGTISHKNCAKISIKIL